MENWKFNILLYILWLLISLVEFLSYYHHILNYEASPVYYIDFGDVPDVTLGYLHCLHDTVTLVELFNCILCLYQTLYKPICTAKPI